MDYAYILRLAWEITRRHKRLWLFGLFVSLSYLSRLQLSPRSLLSWLPNEAQRWITDQIYAPYGALLVVPFLLLLLLLAFGLTVLNTMGRGALVEQTNRVENGAFPSVRAGWEAGKRRLWRLFAIGLILRLPILLIRSAGFLPYILSAYTFYLPPGPSTPPSTATNVGRTLLACFLPALCLSLFLEIPTRLLQRLSVRACVLENRSVGASIGRGWDVLRKSAGTVLVLWLFNAAATAAAVVPAILVIGLPLWGGLVLLIILGASLPTPLVHFDGVLLIFWLTTIIVDSVAEPFFSATWTIAFRDLTGLGRTGEEVEWTPVGKPQAAPDLT